MRKTILSLLLCVVMILSTAPVMAFAASPISAPEHFGVKHDRYDIFHLTLSAPDDLRKIIDNSDPAKILVVNAQVDYKLGAGNWHYTSDWDTAQMTLKNTISVTFTRNEKYISKSSMVVLRRMFPQDIKALQPIIDSDKSIPGTALSFRVRFVTSLDWNKTYIYSDWSDTYVYSKSIVKDPYALINFAPTLTSATIGKNSDGLASLKIMTGRIPGKVQDLNAIVGDEMGTEIWIRKAGETEFKLLNTVPLHNEYIFSGLDFYLNELQASHASESDDMSSFDAEGNYEIKLRYVLNDLGLYPQTGKSEIIYSPFSDVLSQNMSSWSEASKWATAELSRADELGLIPGRLMGYNLTEPISREEFAELAMSLYEKVSSRADEFKFINPFTDTDNPKVIMAFELNIAKGTSSTTFAPLKLINREECAAMLFRTINAIFPDGDFGIEGAKDFPDQENISSWAIVATKYMSKMGIIKGDINGNFMPKAVTTVQQKAGYGMATREGAILMSVRIYDMLLNFPK